MKIEKIWGMLPVCVLVLALNIFGTPCQPGTLASYEALGTIPDYATTPIGTLGCTVGNLEFGGFFSDTSLAVTITPLTDVMNGTWVGFDFQGDDDMNPLDFRIGEDSDAQITFNQGGDPYFPTYTTTIEDDEGTGFIDDLVVDNLYMYGYALPASEMETELSWITPTDGIVMLYPDPADPPPDPAPEPAVWVMLTTGLMMILLSRLWANRAMGHVQLQTTLRYAQLPPSHLADAVERLATPEMSQNGGQTDTAIDTVVLRASCSAG